MPHLKAEIVPKGQIGRPLHLLGSHIPGPDSIWIIGSDPSQCDIGVNSPHICPRQTRIIQHTPSSWEVVCIGGENGTFLNRRRITRAELQIGDEVNNRSPQPAWRGRPHSHLTQSSAHAHRLTIPLAKLANTEAPPAAAITLSCPLRTTSSNDRKTTRTPS